jgi:hypothetical protein
MAINYQTRTVTTTPNTITTNDEIIFSNVASPSSLILPTLGSSSENTGRSFYIKDFSGNSKTNPITITAPSGKTIDGAAFAILNTQYSHILLTYDGTNWKTIAL